MHPVFLKIGDFSIHWYGVFMGAAFLAALAHWTLTGKREGMDFNAASDLMFWTMLSGIIGARLAYVIANRAEYSAEPWRIFKIYEGGLVYYGGFIAAVFAIVVFAVIRKKKLPGFADYVISVLPLGHALGRTGCFLNGCCHGAPTLSSCAVRYPAHSLAWHRQIDVGLIDRFTPKTMPVHPVQLYEAVFNLVLYVLLVYLYRRRLRSGTVLSVYLLLYPAGRFFFEFLRGDERLHIGLFTTAQIFSMALFAAGIVVGAIVYAGRKKTSV